MIEFAAGIGLFIAAFFAMLWRRDHARLRQTMRAHDGVEQTRAGLALSANVLG